MAEVHKSGKYNMLFPKQKIRNQKLKETLGLSLQFLWQRVQEISAISIALPPHLSLALQFYKSNCFPSYSSKLMLLRWWISKTQFRGGIMSHSDHTRVQVKGSTKCWLWHWWQMQQRPVTIGHNYCPTFASDRRGLGWGLKCKDQRKFIKDSSQIPTLPCSQSFTGFCFGWFWGL